MADHTHPAETPSNSGSCERPEPDARLRVTWPDFVEEILAGDQAVMLASITPARGVVMTPVTNFALHDRHRGTVTVNSSVGARKRLERIGGNPQVALVYHTRQHGYSDRPEYLLMQGTARLSEPIADYPATLGANWDRFDGPRATSAIWRRWLRIYYTRVSIEITIERVLAWPQLDCEGVPEVFGADMPSDPPHPQGPPRGGTAPRVDPVRAARRASRLPNVLLGWVGADQRPWVLPVALDGADDSGIALKVPTRLIPPGGRRAGLTGHWFTRYVLGQHQRVLTGWLTANGASVSYAPHTEFGYRLPPSKLLYRLVVGFETHRRVRPMRRDTRRA